ncbi:serine/arginine repetitive matrix protein 2 isoform X2 [Sebastes umbrosus]|uniref:serine/arginine repetitive matrix protein 2 isoform X2 n=1 Tax=Sebastes umbrosus TaxID=72105 RepID=UPI00189D77B0|nr:serine/arginine repetitive matrix protein 2 isoform X2 [Sebastes umbrosus]
MDSWTLQGDSYSFLRSAPHHTYSLCHRDGTPNHVEIFDIINVPSQRSAISETTCLCDIFGDDCDSSSLSSSPAVGAFVLSQREVDGSAAASPPVDDLNDSSGSYHTAPGSSEGEEGFEDSRERLYSPPLQGESSERRQLEGEGLSSGRSEVSEDSSPNLEPKGKPPVPQLSTASPSSEVLNTGERTPSPGHSSPSTLSTEGRASSLSSSSVEKRCSPSSPSPRQACSETEPRTTTPSPSLKDRHNSLSHQSLSPSHSPEPRNRVSSSSSESVNTPDFRVAQGSPGSSYFNQHSTPSPEPTSKDFSLDFTESAVESRATLSSPLPSSSSTYQSRESLASPELNNRPYSPDTQASSPFSEPRGRVSLPDLLSRGSTPDIGYSTHTPELISDPSTAVRDTTTTPESQDRRLSAEPVSAVSTPAPRYTPPSPVISIATSPELVASGVSPELRHTAPSPGRLSAASPATTGTRTPSPDPLHKIRHISSESRTQVSSPVVGYSLSPSPEVTSNSSPIECRFTAPSPEIRITASSPEVSRREWSSEVEKTSASPYSDSASSRSLTSSPHITGISYSVVQPEDISPFPELSRLCTPEPDRTLVSPEARSPTPSRHSRQSSIAESTGTPRDSPHISGFTSSVLQPEITLSHQPRYQTPSPQPKHHTPSPQPRYQTPSSDKHHTPSPGNQTPSSDKHHTPSPGNQTPSSDKHHTPSPGNQTPSSDKHQTPSPPPKHHTPSPQPRYQTPSSDKHHTPSPEPKHHTPSPQPRYQTPSSDKHHTPSPPPKHLTPSPQPRYQTPSSDKHHTPSPQPKHHTPSPGYQTPSSDKHYTPSPQPKHHTPSPGYQTPSSDKHHTPSPQRRSRDPSPVTPSPEQRYHQRSPATLSIEHNPQYTRPTPTLRNTPEVEGDSSYHTHLAKESVSPSFQSDRGNKSVVAEIKSSSPVVAVQSPVSTSPFLAEETVESSLKQQSTEREAAPNLQDNSSLASFLPEEKQSPTFVQKEDTYINPPIDTKPPSPNLQVSKDRSPNISLVHRATSNSPVQRPENAQPQFTAYPMTSESSSSLKSACTPETARRQPSARVRRENRERITEDMAHHVNRRRTPSPPLTRFTPVHIIAPEKPYRQWQNRRHSPSQVGASSPRGHLKKAVTNRESPNVAYVDNNSQAHWVRQARQLEMEREMQLDEDREVGRERQRDREMERERKRREEQVPEKGKGWQGDASYRGEQVELSFNARNRKGPASRSTAPTSRETRQGLPTAHSYPESSLATRQLQQQQLRLASQQDPRGGGPSRRLQPPAPHNKSSVPGRVAANRPCQSSSSSMGSELDEADDEVKWFTDGAFRSLSSPEVDYLDMYNSSHRSSTNMSQPSTQESPAGVSAAWPAYADFRGSAPRLDNDELSFQQPSAHYSDGLDPSRRYEMGSFECVDVAVEREEPRRVRRGVPKRQIQLKRKNSAEGKQDESSENSSPGFPVMVESPSLESHSRETFMRQHSTPAAMQECYRSERSPEPNRQNERKLKKSASLDETCTKTKMATCLIKSVLSKKMQSVDKQEAGEEGSPAFEENSPPIESAPLKESPKPDSHNLSSSLQSDYSLSSEGLPARGELSAKDEAKPPKSFGVRSSNRPSSSSSSRSVTFSQTESEEADSQSRNMTSSRSEMRPELKMPFDSKQSRTGVHGVDDSKTWDGGEGGDSANATAGNSGAPSAIGASSTQARVTNRDRECENTQDHKTLRQGAKGACMTQTQEITLKAVEKKKASLNVCLTPEAENKPEASSPDIKEERIETSVDEKTEEEEEANNKAKVPIHKVRDVRRLVKNTYNLSFKATSAVQPSNVHEEKTEILNKERREEVTAREEREVRQEIRREEREEEFREERKEEMKDSKLLTLSPPPQSKGSPLSRSQPMQIEYKAVCWKEAKNKMPCSKKDSESDKLWASPKLVSRESPSNANTLNNTTGDTVMAKLSQRDLNTAAETQETVTEMHKVPDSEDKPAVVRADRKPPMLGSLPKQPSKEREVSTAVVIIRDGSSKTKISASPAQEEIHTPLQAPAASPSPGHTTPGSSGHSVSMLIKEKGYQADIGAVVGDNHNAPAGKGVPHKHVNCLEIPLQTPTHSDGGRIESHRERTFSSSSITSGPSAAPDNADAFTKTREDEGLSGKPAVKDTARQKSASPLRNAQEQAPPPAKQKELGDFEAVKRLDPTFPPRSPAVRKFRPQPIEVKSLSKETQKQETPTNTTGNSRPQTIEVKSIAKNSQKPAVPPKPSCKFKPADLGTMPNEAQKSSTTTVKPQGEERPQTIVVSSPTIYRKISNESTSTSNYTRKLAVSAVSSLKPPPCKTTAATVSSLNQSNQSTTTSETEVSNDRGQQQNPGASLQSSGYTQRPTTLATAPISATGTGLTSAPGPVPDNQANPVSGPDSAGANQLSRPAVVDPDSQQQYPRMAYPHEQAMPVTSNNTKQPAAVSTTQVPGYTHPPCHRSFSSERPQRIDDLRFYASDDPPSYDERESFSPLMLPDLTQRRSNRYQPSSRPPPCSCTAGCPSHPGITPPHHHRSPHNLTPPAPAHSPGQALPYPVAQPPLRPHQCRPDPQPMSYQPGSPKSSPHGPSQPPAMYQPLHQPPPCPPHPSLMQACPADRPLQPPQHIDPRRPPVHRSPHQQPPGMAGAPYSDPGHNHSPGLPPMDPQYLCGPQGLGPSYGSDYGGDTSSLYSESSYAQTPRRVLLDPETGKYFYIEVPVQPLRKMLFDPETGQYVEVLIPQQAMSHSGLYPPSAAPYTSLHNPNMYAPAPQYMPYAAPPPQAHPQAPPQPPRYPEVSAAPTMHPGGPGVNYRHPSGQGSKPEPQNHPPLDQSYLESMYYVPTGMNASPNPTPPDYYHKHPPNLPPTGGKRS